MSRRRRGTGQSIDERASGSAMHRVGVYKLAADYCRRMRGWSVENEREREEWEEREEREREGMMARRGNRGCEL